jgi:soluble lytic murein transglycosylase-like protein
MRHRAPAVRLVAAIAFLAVLSVWGAAAAPQSPAEIAAMARRDDPAEQFALAHRLDTMMADRRDRARALELYCQAARSGNAEAAFGIGRMFFGGRGVLRDVARAADWFRLAAARGHVLSAHLARSFGTLTSSAPSGCPGFDLRAAMSPDASPYEAGLHEGGPPGTRSRGTGLAVRPTEALAPPEIAALVATLAPEYDLDADLVLAVITVESAFQSDAVSPRRALGLMQLMPETAARFGVTRALDPEENIRGGMKYLRWLRDYFDGDLVLVLAAYNAGEGAVERFGGVPPFPETKAYIEKIRLAYGAPLLSPATTGAP